MWRLALATPVIHVDETRWPRLGSEAPAAGAVWGVATPTAAFYRMVNWGKPSAIMLERWTGLTRFLDNPCIRTVRDSVLYSILVSEWPDVKRHLEFRLVRNSHP